MAAQEIPLRLEELITLARHNNPELRALHKRWEAMQFEVLPAVTLPDPKVSGGFKSMEFGRFSLGSEPMSNVALMFEQEIPFPGKLSLKGALVTQETQMRWQNYRMKTQAVITEIKLHYYDLYYAYQILRVIQANQHILEKFLKTAEIKYAVGQALQPDLLKAHVEITMLGEKRLMWEQKKQALAVELNRLTGRLPDTPVGEPVGLPEKQWNLSFKALQHQIRDFSPELKEQHLQIQTHQLRQSQILQEYLPDFMLSGGYMNRGTLPPMWELMVSVTLPIYAGQKQNYMLQSAQKSVEAAQVEREQRWQVLLAKLKTGLIMAETEQKLKRLYKNDLLPQARQTLDASLASYMVGKIDFLTVLENLNTLLAYEAAIHQKEVNAYKALAEIEDMLAVDMASKSMSVPKQTVPRGWP